MFPFCFINQTAPEPPGRQIEKYFLAQSREKKKLMFLKSYHMFVHSTIHHKRQNKNNNITLLGTYSKKSNTSILKVFHLTHSIKKIWPIFS